MKTVPYIVIEMCVGCGICVEVCPVNVFKMSTDKAVVMTPEKCTGCELCEENCPTEAIELKTIE